MLELSLQLRKMGHTVDVYTSNETRSSGRLEPYSDVQGIQVYRFRSLLGLGEFGKFWPGFVPYMIERDYDVIHAHAYRHPHTDLAVTVSRLKGSASVLTAHSPFHPVGVRGSLAGALVPAYDKLVAPVTLRSFDRIVSLTPAESGRLASLGAPRNRIVEIAHGVGPQNFTRVDSSKFLSKFGLQGQDFVLYLGRINRTKGIDVLLDAFALVSSKRPSVRLVLAGPATSSEETSYLALLKRQVESLSIGSKVIFTGKLTEEEKMEAYDACRFFVLPSRYEPYGIVLLEAAAHSKPSVSTLTDGPRNIIEEGSTGLLVEAGDGVALAKAIERLLADVNLLESMSHKSLEMARRHSWESVASEIFKTYSAI